MKKIILVSAVFILFCWTCCYHKITHLSQDELSYIAYNKLDTLFFQSKHNIADTVIISKIVVNNSFNPFNPFGVETTYDYEANASITMTVIHQGMRFDGLFLIKKVSQGSDAVISAHLGNRFSNEFVPKFSTFLFNDSIIDCVCFNNNNSTISPNIHYMKSSITSFVWSKSMGLLQYSFDNGDVYNLQN